jgi:hypothetical protein
LGEPLELPDSSIRAPPPIGQGIALLLGATTYIGE